MNDATEAIVKISERVEPGDILVYVLMIGLFFLLAFIIFSLGKKIDKLANETRQTNAYMAVFSELFKTVIVGRTKKAGTVEQVEKVDS